METIPLALAIVVIQLLGMPGLIFIIWHFDGKRFAKKDESRRKELEITLTQYREDVADIRRLYESNARLVSSVTEAFTRLEKLYGETISVISLNTQTQTHLADVIKNNQFCPVVRKAGNPDG